MREVVKKIIVLIIVVFLFCITIVLNVMFMTPEQETKDVAVNDNVSIVNMMLETTETIDDSEEEGFDVATEDTELELELNNYSDERYLPSKGFKHVANRDKIDVINFVGDIYLSKRPRSAYDSKGVKGIADDSFRVLLENSDFNVANLECCITEDSENVAEKEFTFSMPNKYAKAIKDLNINLLTLANNHILDFGVPAMLNTMNELKNNGISYMGVGNDLREASKAYIKEIDGKRYAFLSASAVLPYDSWKATKDNAGIFNGYDISLICDEIKKVKPHVDKVIVYMHWGRELDTVSTAGQKQYAHRIVTAGADLVVGAHSHTIQEIEYYNNVPIIYSLGNFIYGETMRDTMLLEVSFDYSIDEHGQMQLKLYPGVSSYEKVRMFWKDADTKERLKTLQDKSSTCYIGDNGYVFTMLQVETALKMLASSSEIN